MSYDIFIGEGVPCEHKNSNWKLTVKRIELDEAPSFPNDSLTGKGNSRHPGYSQWTNFCKEAGLYDLFFNSQNGLMREHPGTVILESFHLDEIKAVKENWVKTNPGSIPGFCADRLGSETEKKDEVSYDPILARLIWLEFWVEWALKNCKTPAIHNY